MRLRMSARSSSTVSNSEASAAHSSVTSGRTFSLTSLTSTLSCDRAVGQVGVEGQDVADPGAAQVVVELGQHRAAAELVEEVVGRHAGDVLTVAGSLEVDGQMIAVAGRAIDGRQLAEVAPQPVDLGVDLLLARHRARDLDPQAVVAGQVQLGSHLDHRVEGQRPGLLTCGDVDLGRGDGVDVVLAKRLRVVVGQGVAEGFVPARSPCPVGLPGCAGEPCRAETPGSAPPWRSCGRRRRRPSRTPAHRPRRSA